MAYINLSRGTGLTQSETQTLVDAPHDLIIAGDIRLKNANMGVQKQDGTQIFSVDNASEGGITFSPDGLGVRSHITRAGTEFFNAANVLTGSIVHESGEGNFTNVAKPYVRYDLGNLAGAVEIDIPTAFPSYVGGAGIDMFVTATLTGNYEDVSNLFILLPDSTGNLTSTLRVDLIIPYMDNRGSAINFSVTARDVDENDIVEVICRDNMAEIIAEAQSITLEFTSINGTPYWTPVIVKSPQAPNPRLNFKTIKETLAGLNNEKTIVIPGLNALTIVEVSQGTPDVNCTGLIYSIDVPTETLTIYPLGAAPIVDVEFSVTYLLTP